jgi:type II secretory pathway component PulF
MLEEVLWRICAFGEQEEELRGKAVTAMVYPTFLLVVGSSAIFILVSFVFPKFVQIFEDFNAQLPWPTVIVMSICNFMGTWWWAVLLGLIAFVVLLFRYYRTEPGRRQFDAFFLRVPAVRTLVIKYEMAKFARTLGTLLDNGVPVLTSLKITSDTMSNRLVRDCVAELHTGVTEGESLSETMHNAKLFPPMVVSMFAIGEESGRIGSVAKRIADAYDLEVDRAVKALTSLFEPLLIVIMGIIIGFLVIAMLLPMLTLSSTIGA